MPIEQALGRLHELSAQEIKALDSLKQLGEDIKAARKAVAELILGGESTGDPISDYVHAYYQGRMQVGEKLRAISAKLKGRKGELVLASYKFKKRIFFGGPHHRESCADYAKCEVLYLGLLSDESLLLDLKTGKADLPTGGAHIRYLIGGTKGFGFNGGNVGEPQTFTDLIGLAEMVMLGSYPPILQKEIELVYGDKETVDWFLNRAVYPLRGEFLADFFRMAKMFGKKIENEMIGAAVLGRKEELLLDLEKLIIEAKQNDLDQRRKASQGKSPNGDDLQKTVILCGKIQGIADEIRGLGQGNDPEFEKLMLEIGR